MSGSEEIENVLEALIEFQRKKVFRLAEELGAHLTTEDILNPHDFPELLRSPRFNFEDGVLTGLLSAQMALRNSMKNRPNSPFSEGDKDG